MKVDFLRPHDGFIDTCVQASCALVAIEFACKLGLSDISLWWEGSFLFLLSFILCVCTEFLDWKDHPIIQSDTFRGFLTVLHACDGISAVVIGLGLTRRNLYILLLGVLMITKLFLIHLMNRMILAHKKPEAKNAVDAFTQTTKSFLHHTASFIFLCQPTEIVITTVWRSISMTGHAALALRGRVNPTTLFLANRLLSYLRIICLAVVLFLLSTNSIVRSEFANSAIGHVAYLMVRFAPVFKQGGAYLHGEDKEKWISLSDEDRIKSLCRFEHPALGAELLLMIVVIVTLLFLRYSLSMVSFVSSVSSLLVSVLAT